MTSPSPSAASPLRGKDGRYRLAVPLVRDADGTPRATTLTLRASAQDYQTFPGGLRTALPISTGEAIESDAGYSIDNPLTDIALLALPGEQQGLASVSGKVQGNSSAGVLVAAEGNSAHTAVADADGDYTIFNVPPGSYEVRGYAAAVQLVPRDVDVVNTDLTGVDLAVANEALSSVSGSIQIVNAPGGAKTSVVLVVAATFSDTFVRGEVPRGLRAPLSGEPSIDGSFTIENVPMGDYVVLAAFENDDLVRDPDPNISGTQIVSVSVGAGEQIMLDQSFKVTEALAVIGPGKDDPEAVSATPTFKWADDSSEDFYSIVLYDAFGDIVWEDAMVPSVSGGDVSVVYAGPALATGLYYQFRATSWRQPGNQEPGPISTTEDFRGVFVVQ